MGWVGPLGMGRSFEDLAKSNTKFFGGGTLMDPGAPKDIVKRAKSFSKK